MEAAEKQRPEAQSSRLLAAQVDLLARQVPALAVGSSLLASGAAYILVHQKQPASLVLYWLACMVGLSAVRVGVYMIYRRAQAPAHLARQWAAVLTAFSAAAGITWGSLGVLFFNPSDPFTLALVVIILTSILSAATSSLSAYWPAHLAFAIPCALPFAVRSFMEGNAALTMLGTLALFFLVFMEVFARSVERSIRESLQLRFDNLELVGQLRSAKERAEEAAQAKSKLLAAVSHDLRQPLHAMSLLASALAAPGREEAPASADVQDIALRMQTDLGAMSEFVTRLLDASRLESGTLEVRLQPCMASTVLKAVSVSGAEAAGAKGLAFRLVESDDWVYTDPVLLHSVVSNLVSNAVKYTRQGGVLLACRRRGSALRIEVWDTGIGIPPHEMDRIHSEYYQASNARDSADSGFGLGLSIVHGLALLLGLRLHVRSRPGRGSVFAIEVPLLEGGARGT